jgi:integrase
MTIKVKLRQKPISGNKVSLYLDFWPPITNLETGESTRREFLKLYMYAPLKPKGKEKKDDTDKKQLVYHKDKLLNAAYKKHNTDTQTIAEGIRQKKEHEMNKPEVYNEYEKEQLRKRQLGEHDFLQYFKEITDKHKGSSYYNWEVVNNYLKDFSSGYLKFANVNEKFCSDFRNYLLNARGRKNTKKILEQNSAGVYFSKFKAALRQAYKDGYLQEDLNTKIESIKEVETQRNFLTIDELNKLVKTDCPSPVIKSAALFSALTGLRFSDIMKLVWGEIEFNKGAGYLIKFRQKKTRGIEVQPISEQAYCLLGERKEPTDRVFEGLEYSAYYNKFLYQWLGAAGITKEITFHCFRHTFATLQLSKGTDIYTVSKMLGHRNIQTTQIYAKVVDKLKREAADRIKLDL